ncbi:MAG: 6,7-dimethyl-8-ribityllumazine synthase [Rhodospirillaceae bacterium]|nr:6,7-dimethyl-8-ribityllumazine synthase [Rhodospirillaceae bacterium]
MMIIEARYYPEIVDELARGAIQVLEQHGSTYKRFEVPGAFEVPAAVRMAIRSMDFSLDRRRFDGYVCLGCVIRGETSHYDIVANESARALQNLACEFTLALGYGIITCDTMEQAWERARVDRRNKGGEAARTVLAMIELKRRLNLYPRQT